MLTRRRALARLGLVVPAALPAALPSPSAAAASGRREAPEFQRIAERGELRVAMLHTDTPPFFYQRGSELAGIDADLARDLARGLALPVHFDRSAASFNDVVDQVSRGEADLGLSKISRTLARARAVRFSEPYLSLHHALLLNRLEFARLAQGRPADAVLRHYDGSLGVIARSSFVDFAHRNFPQARLVELPDWDRVVQAVERGEVVGAYRDEFEVKRLLAERPQAALKLRSVTLKDEIDAIGIAVGADAPTLLSYVNLYLGTRPARLGIQDVLQAMPAANPGSAAR